MIVGVVFIDPQDGLAQNAVGHRVLVLALVTIGKTGNVLLKGGREGGGRRKEPFFEQLVDERRAESILLQRCGADDQDGAGTVPQQHLLDDETGLNGLAQADVIGDEQIDAGHVNGAYQRVKLEVLNTDATAERCLQKTSVRVGGSTPANRIKKSVEGVGVILASN